MSAEPVTILVIDDSRDFAASLALVLEAEGFRPVVQRDGAQALAHLDGHPPPCLIVLDLGMPVMGGWAFLLHKQQRPAVAGVPVLVVTGREAAFSRDDFPDVVGCLVKPVRPTALVDLVRHCCAAAPG